MRPVTRPAAPRAYARYQEAIGDLEACFDIYCSYCERRLQICLEVEHVAAKTIDPARKTDWTNFLLACKTCNLAKGVKPTNPTDFYWPDRDNTMRALAYKEGGIVEANNQLAGQSLTMAKNLIDLVGLDRDPGQVAAKQPTDRDERYRHREEVWSLAKLKREALGRNDNDDYRAIIADLAKAEGFFSVWMSVFADDSDMRRRFVAALRGTATDCFDQNFGFVSRPGGKI